MNLLMRFIIIVTIVISMMEAAVFVAAKRKPELLTMFFLGVIIPATIMPIAIDLWDWLR